MKAARQEVAVRTVAAYILGDHSIHPGKALHTMERLGMCAEAQGIAQLVHSFFLNSELQEEVSMPDAATLAELVKLINDVIAKARRDRLIQLVNAFYSRYTFVLRTWTRMEERHLECREKDNEIAQHLKEAMRAAQAGNADALQEAIAKAEDDLEELAKCLGIEIMPQ